MIKIYQYSCSEMIHLTIYKKKVEIILNKQYNKEYPNEFHGMIIHENKPNLMQKYINQMLI